MRSWSLVVAAVTGLALGGIGGSTGLEIEEPQDPSRPRGERARPKSGAAGQATPYFQNCSAARAAGAAPLRRDDPGYRRALDRDNDGVACE